MSFRSPALLGLLVLVPVVVAAYVSSRRRRGRRTVRLAEQGLVTTALPTGKRVQRHVPFACFAAALTVLVVGLARPQTTVRTPRREGTVILAVDVSNSMRATDVSPSRMDVAKATARDFVRRQAAHVRIGVVAFGDGATLVQTPTTSHPDVLAAIGRLSVGGGTSLGQGLVTALGAVAGKPVAIDAEALASDSAEVDIGFFGSATVVLLSDGEQTGRPDPVSVAKVVAVAGIHVHAIGIGTDAGTVVPIDGFNVATALDRDLLDQVASVTDGSYHDATDAGAVRAVTRTIDVRTKLIAQHTEVTGVFSAAGVLLLLLGAVLSVLWYGRVL